MCSVLLLLVILSINAQSQDKKYYIVFNNFIETRNLVGGGTVMEYLYYQPFLDEIKTKNYVIQAPFGAATFGQKDITEYDVAIFPMGALTLNENIDGIKVWDKIIEMLDAQKSVIIIGTKWLGDGFKGGNSSIKSFFQNTVGIDYFGPTSCMKGNTYVPFLIDAEDSSPICKGWEKYCNQIRSENGSEFAPPFDWSTEFQAFKFRIGTKAKGFDKVDSVGDAEYKDLWAGAYWQNDKARLVFWSIDFEMATKIHDLYFQNSLVSAAQWCVRDYPSPGAKLLTIPGALEFDNVQPTKTKILQFDLQNYGREPLKINKFSIDDNAGVFQITEGGEPITLAPFDITTVYVAFTPKDLYEYSANLDIASNSVDGIYALPLSGKGGDEVINGPKLSITKFPVDFGLVPFSDNAIKNIQISDIGNQTMIVDVVDMFYNPSGNFTWADPLKTPITIPAGKSSYQRVKYTASKEAGSIDTAYIALKTNALNNGGLDTFRLIAKGAAKGSNTGISLSNTKIDFGDVIVGKNKDFTLLIKNNASSDITVFNVTTKGDPENLEQFNFVNNSNKNIPPIKPGTSYQLVMNFAPAEAKSYGISIKLFTNDQGTPNIEIPVVGVGSGGGYVEDGILKLSNDFEMTCRPNPVTSNSEININYTGSVDKNIKLLLYEMSGKIVNEIFTGTIKSGTQSYNLSSDSLVSGKYFINVDLNGVVAQLPIVINK